jgi:hypothetical protein
MAQQIKNFLLVFIFQIPAIFISILIFLYFAFNRVARSKTKNHIWLILLIVNFFYLVTDLPMSMSYFYQGKVWPEKDAYCVWWSWYELSLDSLGLYLMAWASIERHLFIFHSHDIMRVRWKIWIFHFIPIFLCFIWIFAFQFVFIVISPTCINTWQFDENMCGTPCFITTNGIYGLVDFIVNVTFPIAVITFANIALLVRAIYQKISHHQVVNWRRHRKMIFQLWLISSLYLALWLPFTLSQIVRFTIAPTFFLDQYNTLLFIIYFIPLLLPIACLNTFPELLEKLREIIRRRIRMNRVGTTTVATVR